MSYTFTHLWYVLRKHITRKESRPGNFRRLIGAMVLGVGIVVSGRFIPEYLDETLLLKTLFSIRGPVTPPENVVLVKIDDTSYKKLGISPRKPFPREVSARAVRSILEDKPKVLFLDLYLPKEEEEEDGTMVLAEAFKMGTVSIARPPVDIKEREKESDSESAFYESDPLIAQAAKYQIPMTVSELAGLTLYINLDLENFFRVPVYTSVPLLKPLHDHVSPELPAPQQTALINYYGPEGTIRSFSLWELFEDERLIPSGFFRDKLVLLGFKSELRGRGHSDKEVLGVPVRSKSSGYEMYGVEIHATIMGNLLESNWITNLEYSKEVLIKCWLLFFLTLGIISFHPFTALLFMVFFLSVWFVITFLLFSYCNLFIPGVFLALLYSPFIYAGAACTRATIALRELEGIKRTFGVS